MKINDEIDRLYQLPLKEFTPARNALAKTSGVDAAGIRALLKPTVPAWAVNQLYWRERKVYDQLIDAAEKLRTAHRSLLAGTSVDLHAAEAVHRDKIRAASQAVRAILADADESQSPANLTAISETLEALPTADETAGRLTKALKRMGFEALAGVGPRPASSPARSLSLVKPRDKEHAKPPISDTRKREIDELEARANKIAAEERQQLADVERARRELQRAETAQQRIEEELAEAVEKVKQLRADLSAREKAHKAIAAEQSKVEQRLEKLKAP